MKDFLRNGGQWVVAQSVLMLAVLGLGPSLRNPSWPWSCLAFGAALFVFGGWLGLAGVRALGRNRTALPKPRPDSALVQHGVYGVVRHPLYSSLMFTAVGWSLLWGSGAALTAAGALTLLLHAKARREERWLRERYAEYRDYEQRVKRFIPRLW